MSIKVLIVVLFICLLLSLFSGLVFLVRDQGSSRRTVWSLGIRLGFAVALILVLIYGLRFGALGSKAPWDLRPPNNALQDIHEQE